MRGVCCHVASLNKEIFFQPLCFVDMILSQEKTDNTATIKYGPINLLDHSRRLQLEDLKLNKIESNHLLFCCKLYNK